MSLGPDVTVAPVCGEASPCDDYHGTLGGAKQNWAFGIRGLLPIMESQMDTNKAIERLLGSV